MNYLSICSGIEAASVAWKDLDWHAVGFSEIEPFPCAVLSHHFPNTPNFGDMTKHAEWNIAPGAANLVVGGTPCQSFSVAGLRSGMADPRGNLALTFLSICNRLRPEWIVWENVPGVLSSNGGRDFGSFLGALAELGYGFAYRVLDAQHFGVAQRRRRVFVVANATDWRRAAAVLFEPESLRGNPAPSRAKGQVAAAGARNGAKTISDPVTSKWAKGAGGPAGDECQNLTLDIPPAVLVPPAPANPSHWEGGPHPTLNRPNGSPGYSDQELFSQRGAMLAPALEPFVKAKRAQSAEDDETWEAGRPAPTLSVFDSGDTRATVAIVTPAIAFEPKIAAREGGSSRFSVEKSPTLRSHAGDNQPAIAQGYAVRRLTPVECERLQGFPDDWTAISYRGKPAADGPRYKAIGNSMAVPVMRWIGERIDAIDKATKEQP